MRTRTLGSTGITVSALTFGCGNVGGLMVRGAERDQREAVARALDAGISYFDTAALYGNGLSEETLGRVLPASETRAAVGTKVRLPMDAFSRGGGVAAAIRRALEDSLRRLRREAVDLYQLHNPIDDAGGGEALTVRQVLDQVLPAFQDLRREGKTRGIGFTALGEAGAIERLAAAGGFAVAQVPFNLLDPSAADAGAGGGSARLLRPAGAGLGTIGIRLLAGGALAGETARHPIAAPTVAPIGCGRGSASDYEADVAAAGRFQRLVDAGAATSLPGLASATGCRVPASTRWRSASRAWRISRRRSTLSRPDRWAPTYWKRSAKSRSPDGRRTHHKSYAPEADMSSSPRCRRRQTAKTSDFGTPAVVEPSTRRSESICVRLTLLHNQCCDGS